MRHGAQVDRAQVELDAELTEQRIRVEVRDQLTLTSNDVSFGRSLGGVGTTST